MKNKFTLILAMILAFAELSPISGIYCMEDTEEDDTEIEVSDITEELIEEPEIQEIEEDVPAEEEELTEYPEEEPDDQNAETGLPKKFSYRDIMPEVRDQHENICWSYSTIAAMEAGLILKGAANKNIDLSELQLAYFTHHDYADPKGNFRGDSIKWTGDGDYTNNGAWYEVPINALANGIGPVNEEDVPTTEGSEYIPADEYATEHNVASLMSAYQIEPENRDEIKQAIMNTGGAIVTIYSGRGNYNEQTNAYYCSDGKSDHSAFCIGWDDEFPAENFAPEKPEHDGAWLIRSHGGQDNDSMEGYYWISYEDSVVSGYPFYFVEADPKVYGNTYSYDRTMYENDYVSSFTNVMEISQKYSIGAGEEIKAVTAFMTVGNKTVYVSVTDGEKTVTGQFESHYKGYYKCVLDDTIITNKETEIEVTLKIVENDGIFASVALEKVGSGKEKDLEYVSAKSGPGCKINGKMYENDARIKVHTDNISGSRNIKLDLSEKRRNPVYRIYNPISGEHFYTQSLIEKVNLVAAGWQYEGIAFYTASKTSRPVYRIYRPEFGDHLYAATEEEYRRYIAEGGIPEGIAWYSNGKFGMEVHRLIDKNRDRCNVVYVTNYIEKMNLMNAGWTLELAGLMALNYW